MAALEIRPVVLVGIGPQAERTVERYVRLVGERQGDMPALLPAILTYSPYEVLFRRERKNVQQITFSSPVFDRESSWPLWLPAELRQLPSAQRDGTRAWMRAALLQRIDDLQEFWLERIPRLLSFASVEQLAEQGFKLAANSEIQIQVVADLGDPLGSGIFADILCLIASVCRQVGLRPMASGLLYLPNAISPAPMEEAIAYAALKELEYRTGDHAYPGESVSPDLRGRDPVPLNNGCYLLDTVNEAGYTLEDEEQLVAIVCEQLYAMSFLDLESTVREHRNRRFQRATLRGKGRVYESFGVAIRYIPRKLLSNWANARLGAEMAGAVLDERPGADVEHRVRAFVERVGLRIGDLESALRQTDLAPRVEQLLASIRQAGTRQLEARARTVLQTLRERVLPTLGARVEDRAAVELGELRAALAEEIGTTLEESPAGGVRMALSFLDRLGSTLSELDEAIAERTSQHQTELSRSLGAVSESYYALRNVRMGTPPWPVVLLGVAAALLFPLLYLVLLIYWVILPQSAIWALGVSGILAAGVLAVSAFVGYRLLDQKRHLVKLHADMVSERFRLESDPIVHRQIARLYREARRAVDQATSDLQVLVAQLEALRTHFELEGNAHAGQLQALTSPGPSRSAVTLELAERFYRASVPDRESLLAALVGSAGTVSDWLARCAGSVESFEEWLYDQVSRFGAEYLEPHVKRFTITEALTWARNGLEAIVERLFVGAQPLWNYDPRFLRRAKTDRMIFVGADMEQGDWSSLLDRAEETESEIVLHHTGDPSALIVLTIHQGVPLFALRRIGQYRTHYAETLWRGKLPVHTTNSLLLVEDLIPMRRQPHLDPATLFSTGLALNVIRRDPDGRYVAPRGENSTIRLSAQKERAVALMSMDGPTCREVQRRLEGLVARQGAEVIDERLDEYATEVPGLADWEVRGIVEFGRLYGADGSEE